MEAGKKSKEEQTTMTCMYEDDTMKSIASCTNLKSSLKRTK